MDDFKILGTGSYGCVIDKAFPCSRKNVDEFETTKFVEYKFNRVDMINREIAINKKILKMKTDVYDPDESFCLIKGNCQVNMATLKKYKKLAEQCNFDLNSRYTSLYLDNCGIDMFIRSDNKHLYEDLKNPQIFHNNVVRLLRGLKQLKKNKILLCDIKPENLIYKDKKIKFLDFGGAIFIKNTSDFMSRFSFTRGFIPIEAVYYSSHNNFITRESLKNHIMYLTEIADTTYIDEIVDNLIVDHDNFVADYYKDVVYKFDIYSLGKSLIEIVNNFKNLFSTELIDFLSKMVRFDYRLRPNVDQLLDHPYIKSFKMVKTLIKKPLLEKVSVKKPLLKKVSVKKTLLEKVSVKSPKKAPAKKPLLKKVSVKRKAPSKKTPPKKTPPKKAPIKKAPPKKAPVKSPKKALLKKVSAKSPRKNPVKRKPVKKQSPKALNLGNKNNQTKKKRKTRSNKGVPRGKYKKKVV